MKTALLIVAGIGLIWFLCNRIWQGKEYKMWNKIATRKDKIMDLVFILGMGIVLLGIFFVASNLSMKGHKPKTAGASARTKRVQPGQQGASAQKGKAGQRSTPPQKYIPPSRRP